MIGIYCFVSALLIFFFFFCKEHSRSKEADFPRLPLNLEFMLLLWLYS